MIEELQNERKRTELNSHAKHVLDKVWDWGDDMFIDLQALVNNIVPFMGVAFMFCLIADRFENKETVK